MIALLIYGHIVVLGVICYFYIYGLWLILTLFTADTVYCSNSRDPIHLFLLIQLLTVNFIMNELLFPLGYMMSIGLVVRGNHSSFTILPNEMGNDDLPFVVAHYYWKGSLVL